MSTAAHLPWLFVFRLLGSSVLVVGRPQTSEAMFRHFVHHLFLLESFLLDFRSLHTLPATPKQLRGLYRYMASQVAARLKTIVNNTH